MKCPVCRATYRSNWGGEEGELSLNSQPQTGRTVLCRRCHVDLSPLIRIHDQALWYHRCALHLTAAREYGQARESNDQALSLQQNNADFHALAGRLWALQGEFRQAIASWQQALRLDPENSTAQNCLQLMTELTQASSWNPT